LAKLEECFTILFFNYIVYNTIIEGALKTHTVVTLGYTLLVGVIFNAASLLCILIVICTIASQIA